MKLRQSHFVALGVSVLVTSLVSEAGAETFAKVPIAGREAVLMSAHGGAVYFTSHDGSALHLSKSDGTLAGTVTLAKLDDVLQGAQPPYVLAHAATPSGLLFVLEGTTGESLWISNGSAATTKKIVDLPRDSAHPNPIRMAYGIGNLGAKTVLTRTTIVTGKAYNALLATDGTAAGTVDLGLATLSQAVEVMGNKAYVVDTDGNVRATDGTSVSAALVLPNRESSFPTYILASCNGRLYLSFKSIGPWRTVSYDGTSAPAPVLDGDAVRPGFACTASNYFFFPLLNYTREPWVVDGAGAHLVGDPNDTERPRIFPENNPPLVGTLGDRLIMPLHVGSNDGYDGFLYASTPAGDAMTKLSSDSADTYMPVGTIGGKHYFTLGPFESRELMTTDGATVTKAAIAGGVPSLEGHGVVVGSRLISAMIPFNQPSSLFVIDTGVPAGSSSGSTSSSSGGTSSGGASSTSSGGTSSTSSGGPPVAGPEATDEGGGGCATSPAGASGFALVGIAGIALVVARRRRSRA